MKSLNKSTLAIALGTLVIGLVLGRLFFGRSDLPVHEHTSESINQTWTCSMHPQIRQPEFGKCPLCGMDLIPVAEGEFEENPNEIQMSPTAMQLANVQTSIVTRQIPSKEVRLDGKIQADEHYVSSQTSHISGRIEQLLINYMGEYVSKGQTIAYIYSPELVTAQEELFEARKIKETQPELFAATIEKLKKWKLTTQQIDKIIKSEIVIENFPVVSDIAGIVTRKYVNVGDYLKKGVPFFEVANLSKIWVLFDIYESDLSWVKKGNEVVFTIQSLPGESFRGKISFIDPVINPKTRVAKARIAIDNPGQRLKPEMFVSGLLKSPMMNNELSIIIPKSAVMWTGKRSVVYVKSPSNLEVRFSLREVILGTSLGDSYVILEGLEEDEEIVTHGAFSIDAAAQLAGKPSMMNPRGEEAVNSHEASIDDPKNNKRVRNVNLTFDVSDKFKNQLKKVLEAYLSLKEALVNTDTEKAIKTANALFSSIGKVDMNLIDGEAHQIWMKDLSILKRNIEMIMEKNEMENIRKAFSPLSDQLYYTLVKFKVEGIHAYRQYCPMVFENKGAFWLSIEEEIRNPYFGDAMLTCGEVKEKIN